MKNKNLKEYGFEFLLIFIAVISAFALNNWNENRKDLNTENKILTEIVNGLKKDIEDVKLNMGGHEDGLESCKYFSDMLFGLNVRSDSVIWKFRNLTRDYVSIQNVAGYETLKSKGLEIIKNDSLRSEIISLYEFDYNILKKFEEEYSEMQFQENYYKEIGNILAPNFKIDKNGEIIGINLPLKISKAERNKILLHLWKIKHNREFILGYYGQVVIKINDLIEKIRKEIE